MNDIQTLLSKTWNFWGSLYKRQEKQMKRDAKNSWLKNKNENKRVKEGDTQSVWIFNIQELFHLQHMNYSRQPPSRDTDTLHIQTQHWRHYKHLNAAQIIIKHHWTCLFRSMMNVFEKTQTRPDLTWKESDINSHLTEEPRGIYT